MFTQKSVLLLNGISSGVTGIGLVVLSRQASSLFAISDSKPFVFTGIFLIVFAIFVIATGMRKNPDRGALKMINALDLLWILASIAVLIADGALISTIGNILIAAVAAWVGLMVVLQRRSTEKQLVSL